MILYLIQFALGARDLKLNIYLVTYYCIQEKNWGNVFRSFQVICPNSDTQILAAILQGPRKALEFIFKNLRILIMFSLYTIVIYMIFVQLQISCNLSQGSNFGYFLHSYTTSNLVHPPYGTNGTKDTIHKIRNHEQYKFCIITKPQFAQNNEYKTINITKQTL